MRAFLIYPLLVGIVLFSAAGCARRPVPTERPAFLSQQELVTRLKIRTASWETYQAQLQLRAESPKGRFRIQSVVLAQMPDQFRLEAFNPLGQTVGVLVLNGGRAVLWIPSEKALYTADEAERLIDHFLGVRIPPEAFAYSLAACVPPQELNRLQVLAEPFGWAAHAQDPRQGLAFTWQFLSDPPALKAVYVRTGRSDYSVHYEPAVLLNPRQAPERVVFSSSQWRMAVTVSQIKSVSDLPPSTFDPPFPKGVREVSLSGAR